MPIEKKITVLWLHFAVFLTSFKDSFNTTNLIGSGGLPARLLFYPGPNSKPSVCARRACGTDNQNRRKKSVKKILS